MRGVTQYGRGKAARILLDALEPRRLLAGIEYPADAGVVNLTNWSANPSLNAIPNDGLDDTAAIQAAIGVYVGTKKVLYLPDGLYNVSDRIYFGYSEGRDRYLWLQGQSQANTILKLSDNNPLYQDASPAGLRQVLDTYRPGNNNRAFGQYVSDLTVDVGTGNPGAVGIRYMSNNFGSLRNVTIKSSDPAYVGARGLDMAFEEPGPSLIKNLTVTGFDTGILGAPDTFSATLETINLSHQRVEGIVTYRLPLSINNLVSNNAPSVEVIRSLSSFGRGHIVVKNSVFNAIGTPVAGSTAVVNDIGDQSGAGIILLDDVSTTGYDFAVRDLVANVTVPGGFVEQYSTEAPLSLNPSPTSTLELPVVTTPEVSDPLSNWVSVTSFGATPNANNANGLDDDTAAIQAALDSGASTIYFPNGSYNVSDTLIVRGNVKRIAGLYSNINVIAPLFGSGQAVFKFTGTSQPVQQIDNLTIGSEPSAAWVSFEHATLSDLVILDVEASGYRNSVRGGRVFIEDISGTDFVFDHQTAFGWQINPEGDFPASKITNIGGSLWILGLKVEGKNTIITTTNGGRTEVLGGLVYPVTQEFPARPAFINDESSLAISFAESTYIPNGTYSTYVREIRDGITSNLDRNSPGLNLARNGGLNLNLYTGYEVDLTPPPAPVVTATTTTNSVTLNWPAVIDPQTTVAGYRIYRGATYLGIAPSNTFTDTGLSDALGLTYSVVAYNAAGLSSAPATVTTSTLTDTTAPVLLLARAEEQANTIKLTFSEPLANSAAVTNTASYSISPAVTLTSATLSTDGRSLTLKASNLPTGSYTLTITGSGITDQATTPNALPALSTTAFSAVTGTGLLATYYDNDNFTGTSLTRLEPVINFPYGSGSPDPTIGADTFSARFEGFVEPLYSETYTFTTRTDDGVRLWVNGQNLVNRWQNQGPTDYSGTINLEAGKRYSIVMDYYEGGSGAEARLRWSSPSQPLQIIPTARLFPAPFASTPVIIRNTTGLGADTSVNLIGTPEDRGTFGDVGINNRIYGSYFSDAVYVRLDLNSLDLANKNVSLATFISNLGGFSSDSIRNVNVFGVLDSLNEDNWTETGPGFLTWATAPGSRGTASGGNADPATSVFLGRILVDNTGFQLNGHRDGMAFTSQRLIDFLNADTDGLVTFVLKRLEPNSFEGTNLTTKEGSTTRAPGLVLALTPATLPAPPPPPLPPASDTGTSATDNLTRLTNSSPATALTFTLQDLTPGALVTLYADGIEIGQTVATSTTATLITRGNVALNTGQRFITASQTLGTATSPLSPALPITIDSTAPVVIVTTFQATASPQALNFFLSEAPAAAPSVSWLTLVDVSTGVPVPVNYSNLTAVFNSGTLSFTFPGYPGQSLPKGLYQATLNAAAIGDAAGNTPASNAMHSFLYVPAAQTLTLAPNLITPVVRQLLVTATGALDLTNNALVLDYSGVITPTPAVIPLLASGFAGGTWTGTGIRSSTAATDPELIHSIAFAEASDLLALSGAATDTWLGAPVDSTSLLLRYTYTGDTDLSGDLDGRDLANSIEGLSTGGTTWTTGDFNYNGTATAADYQRLLTAYTLSSSPRPGPSAGRGVAPASSTSHPAILLGLPRTAGPQSDSPLLRRRGTVFSDFLVTDDQTLA